MTTPPQHQLVGLLSGARVSGTTSATSAALPELVTFVGFVDGVVTSPLTGNDWVLMYLDAQLQSWLLVEEPRIANSAKLEEDNAPSEARDVIWVERDAAVGIGRGRQSDEARFLTGHFTRAGDFDAAPAGGTMAASTGVFCGANTALCCRRVSQG